MLKIESIKRKIKTIIIRIIKKSFAVNKFLLKFIPVKNKKDTVLIVKLDAIGDYFMFRNFLQVIRESEKFKNFHITLIGNIAWKDITETFDNEFIDESLWLNRKEFVQNIKYQYNILKKIRLKGFEYVIHPTYSREYNYGDLIVKISKAKYLIGSEGDFSNITEKDKSKSDKYYTSLIPAVKETLFEFDRYKEFFENYLNIKINIDLFLDLSKSNCKNPLDSSINSYFVIFPGANGPDRRWGINNYYLISEYIYNLYGYTTIILGGSQDTILAESFIKLSGNKIPVIDLTGKTNLVQLALILSNAKLLISNDTSAVHIGAAVDMKVIQISKGNHFGRFTPYPAHLNKSVYSIYPELIMENINNVEYLNEKYKYNRDKNLKIEDVNIQKVKNLIMNIVK